MWQMSTTNIAIFWIALIIILCIIELMTVGLTTIWFAGGALAALVLDLVKAPVWLQIVVFFIVALIMLFFTRPWAIKYLKPRQVKTNYEELIGKQARVTELVDNQTGTGAAVVNGQTWTARAAQDGTQIPVDTITEITDIQGVKLFLKPIEK